MKAFIKIYFLLLLFLPFFILFSGCSKDDDSHKDTPPKTVSVSDDGTTISFSAGHPGLERLKVKSISKGSATISVFAPARIVASISSALSSDEKIVLFESPDITTLYSQYRQAKSNLQLAGKNLERIKDMYVNLAATGKDVNQAENDAANARAAISEMESRLRSAGFNPKELDETHPGTVWLLVDVLESQLHEVQKGEEVDVYLNSFPNQKFTGRAVALGDVVDQATRTIKVRVTMPDYKKQFLPGMFGKVDFGDPHDGVILIPLSSVVTVEGKDYVFLQTGDNEFKRKQVFLLEQNDKEVLVQSGIGSGDKIVTEGTMLLKGLSFKF